MCKTNEGVGWVGRRAPRMKLNVYVVVLMFDVALVEMTHLQQP